MGVKYYTVNTKQKILGGRQETKREKAPNYN